MEPNFFRGSSTFLRNLRISALFWALNTLPVSVGHAEPPQEQLTKISAAEATRLAAQYVARRKLDVSGHRILPARLVEFQPLFKRGDFGEGPYWLLTYELPRTDGGQYFVFVSQDQKVGHSPGL